MLEYAVPMGASLDWWPGLDRDVGGDEEEYEKEAKKKNRSVDSFCAVETTRGEIVEVVYKLYSKMGMR